MQNRQVPTLEVNLSGMCTSVNKQFDYIGKTTRVEKISINVLCQYQILKRILCEI